MVIDELKGTRIGQLIYVRAEDSQAESVREQ